MTGKEDFCHYAKKMLDDEIKGKREYSEFVEHIQNVIDDGNTSEIERAELDRFRRDIEGDIQRQEQRHAIKIAALIRGHCQGIVDIDVEELTR